MALNKASAIIKEGLAVHDWPKAITKALGLVRIPIKRLNRRVWALIRDETTTAMRRTISGCLVPIAARSNDRLQLHISRPFMVA